MCVELGHKVVKTRKKHICFRCNKTIEPGTHVPTKSYVADGRAYTLYWHFVCLYLCESCEYWFDDEGCSGCQGEFPEVSDG